MARAKKQVEDTSFKEFLLALDEIERTKGIDKEELIEAVEAALISAYKKENGGEVNVKVIIDRVTGQLKVFSQKEVVEEVEAETLHMALSDARKINPAYEPGDIVDVEINPKGFGRMAAQNAKQLILQRIKEAERNKIYDTFIERKDELVTGTISRVERNDVYIAIDKYEAVMNQAHQLPNEQYVPGMRIKVYISDVIKTNKGAVIQVSRTHTGLIMRLFELEIPEVYDGTVVVKGVSRDAGSRSKVAVYSERENVDAIGSCIGPRGTRIMNILTELGEEKIDMIEYSSDPAQYIKNAISPATVEEVIVDEEARSAVIIVKDDQQSLAIGIGGQNVRLAAKLTGYKLDIKLREEYERMAEDKEEELLLQAELTQDLAAEYPDDDVDLSIFDGIGDDQVWEVE